jgi:sulfur-oxidizing protein SoxA
MTAKANSLFKLHCWSLLCCWLLIGCSKTVTENSEPSRALSKSISGYYFQSAETQALQDDNFANPGMLWVDRGEELWHLSQAGEASSCQNCHDDASSSMSGVAARYPKFSAEINKLINLEGQINHCRTKRQQASALPYESDELLSLTAYVAHQSKGLPVNVAIDGPAAPAFTAGQQYFYSRRGQMNLACHHCHELNAGRMLRGDKLSQGQTGGYPTYRLEWQTIGSLHRRLRFCNVGVRAEPFDFGAQEYVQLELFLAWRAQGLAVETPAVRR